MQINIIFTGLLVFAGFICNLTAASIASKAIGNPAYFGDLFAFVQIEFILGMFLSCGIDLAIDKFFPKFIYQNKNKAIEIYHKFYLSIIGIMFLAFILVMLGVYGFYYFGNIESQDSCIENKNLFINNLYLLSVSFIIAINCYLCKILRVYGHLILATANYVFTPLLIFLISISVFSIKESHVFAQIYSLSWVITFISSVFLVRKYVGINFSVSLSILFKNIFSRIKHIKNTFRKRIFKDSLYLLLSSTSDNSFGMSVIAINIVLANSSDVGLAAAINTVCLLYAVVIKTLSSLYRPSLKLKMLQNKDEAIKFIKTYTMSGLILSVILTMVYVIYGEQILALIYGHIYTHAYVPLIIVAIAFCLVEGFTIHKITLELYKSKSIAKLVMFTNVSSVSLVMLFGFFYGLIGAVSGFLAGRLLYVIIINQKFYRLLSDLKRGVV